MSTTAGKARRPVRRSARRLDMRLTEDQDNLLRTAAAEQGESMTGFVIGAATERARMVMERRHRIEVDASVFRRFAEALDRPDEEMPVLRRYARE